MQPDHPVHDGNIARCVDKHPWCRARMWEAKGRRVKNGTAWQVEQCLSWMIGRWNMACWFRVDSGNVEVKVKHIQTLWGLQLNRKYSKVMFFFFKEMIINVCAYWRSLIINNHHIPSETMEKDRIDSQVTDHSQENFSIVFGAMGRDPGTLSWDRQKLRFGRWVSDGENQAFLKMNPLKSFKIPIFIKSSQIHICHIPVVLIRIWSGSWFEHVTKYLDNDYLP